MRFPISPSALWLAPALILSAGSILAQADGKGAAVEERVSKAIAAWTDLSSVALTDEVSRGLSNQAIRALDEIPKRNAGVSRGRLEAVAPIWSVAVTTKSKLPPATLPGVPVNARVAALKLNQVGSACKLPKASTALAL